MRNFKRCICKNKIRPNSAVCYFSAVSVKLMRFHGGNWHRRQRERSPFLPRYSRLMPAWISEELACRGEENPTKRVYCLVLYIPFIYGGEEGVFVLILSLIDARVKAVVSPPFGWFQAHRFSRSLAREGRRCFELAVISSVCSKVSLTGGNRNPRESQECRGKRRGLSSALHCLVIWEMRNHRDEFHKVRWKKSWKSL